MMPCPVCRQTVDLNNAGNIAMHRIAGRDGWTFCPMSGEPRARGGGGVMRRPTPPENVRIVRADGDVVPCELVYDGERPDDDGGLVHTWSAVTSVAVRDGDRLQVGMLPARTRITVRVNPRRAPGRRS